MWQVGAPLEVHLQHWLLQFYMKRFLTSSLLNVSLIRTFLSVLFVAIALTGVSLAAPVFSQRVANPSSSDAGTISDVNGLSNRGAQAADNLTLASPATVRSVKWWGYFDDNAVPIAPISFDIVFYADAGGLPDQGNILSSTSVTFAEIADTGENFGGDPGEEDIYVFEANVPPTNLPGGTQVWFSVLADSGNSNDGEFFWRFDSITGAYGAARLDFAAANPFQREPERDFSFVLDDAPIPGSFPEITSFRRIGGDVYELTLEGKSSTTYELRSSVSLEFNSGATVLYLTQGDPGDPGTIGGLDERILTTDSNGDATVQMTFTEPRMFVRAQSTE